MIFEVARLETKGTILSSKKKVPTMRRSKIDSLDKKMNLDLPEIGRNSALSSVRNLPKLSVYKKCNILVYF